MSFRVGVGPNLSKPLAAPDIVLLPLRVPQTTDISIFDKKRILYLTNLKRAILAKCVA